MRAMPLAAALALAACQSETAPAPDAPASPSPLATAPGQPGGLPDDRTPIAEGPIDDTSAQGAGQVLQRYYAALEAKEYDAAWRLWSDGGAGSGQDAAAFAESFAGYSEYHAEIGAPGDMEGAAGSIYVEVPVRVYGKTTAGADFSNRGVATLRRVNDVPGSTAEQRHWQVYNVSVDTPR